MGRMFQAEGTEDARALRLVCVWHVGGMTRGPELAMSVVIRTLAYTMREVRRCEVLREIHDVKFISVFKTSLAAVYGNENGSKTPLRMGR
jgi:hypothetical protein